VKIALGKNTIEWQAKARAYADEYLQPHEVEAELNGGVIAEEITERNKKRAIELGFSAIDVPASYGGLELPLVDQVAIWEQLGRVTNALSWCFSEPQQWMFDACSDAQIEQYILPMMRGELKDCYAITESGPGSDVAGIEATAVKDGDNYILNGEKWYVTSANLADFFWFQARLPEENDDALFFVDQGTPGIEMTANPLFSHTYAAHHPTYQFDNVSVPASSRVGAARLIEEATSFAQQRIVNGEPLSEKQAIQFMLADCATELWAARLMTYEAAAADDRGDDLKTSAS
jgi:alkylation response protein AidB-like acyl-CoA dehydrogenase